MSPKRILIVEDHAIVARSIAQQLAIFGYEPVAQTPRGEQAVELAGQLRPDLVLMDIQLAGEMDGIAAARAIRERFAIPVVFLTAFAEDATLERAKVAEPFGYIVKPFQDRELRTVIEMALYKHKAEEALRTSEARYRKLFEEATEGIALADATTGEILDCNQAFSQLSGYDRLELIGKPQTVLHPAEEGSPTVTRSFAQHRDREDGAVHTVDLVTKAGEARQVEIKANVLEVGGRKVMQGFFRDITAEARYRHERETTLKLLHLLNDPDNTRELVRSLTGFFQEWTGCEAVGIRLRDGDDFPYVETRGFPPEFVQAENQLCLRDATGDVVRDSCGNPVLECMCGNVLCGRFNPALPFFTSKGSFWTNSTSELLAGTSEADRQARTRNRCNGEGYESVALIALRHGGETIGLLQLNDRAKGRFTPETITFLERAADQIAMALGQRQVQAALRTSEEQLRAVIDTSPDAIALLDLEGRCLLANQWAARLAGFESPEELLSSGKNGFDFLVPEDRQRAGDNLRKLIEANVLRDVEYDMVGRNGRRLPVEVSASLQRDSRGNPKRVTLVARDITARKWAVETLRLNSVRFREVSSSITDIAYSCERGPEGDYVVEWITGATEAVLGYSAYELRALGSWGSLVLEEDRPLFEENVTALAPGASGACDLRVRTREGHVRWVASYSRCSRSPEDQSEFVIYGALVDITERKRMEQELFETHQRLQAVLRAVPLGVAFSHEPACRRVAANPALLAQFEATPEDNVSASAPDTGAAGREVRYFAEGRQLGDAELPLQRAAAENREIGPVEFEVELPSGRRWFAQAVAAPIRDTCGDVIGAVAVVADIDDRKRAEEQLRETNARLEEALARAEKLAVRAEAANRAKSEFLANMSHEIRTPMTAILGFVELLESSNLLDQEQRDFLAGIQRNGQALLGLISDILDLSRIEADRLTLARVDYPIRQVIDDALSVVQVQADKKGLALELDYAYPVPETIHTDPVRLRQVLANLLGNAVKFTERGSVRIAVRCTQETEGFARVQFAVSDTGIGIPPDEIGVLFDPFTQVDGSATRRHGGTGLGLAISKRLAKALGGGVEVASRLGEGSTFTLTVDAGPLKGVRMLQSPTVPSTAEEEPFSTEPELTLHGRVLLAEDVPDISVVLRQILQKMNLEVEIAEDGRQACEMAQKSRSEARPFDLILMDIQMPTMNGYEATRWLRQHGWHGPIVALTAHALFGDCDKCLEAGCDDYMPKPIAMKGLRGVLTRYLGHAAAAGGGPASAPETARAPDGLLDGGILDPSKAAALVDAFRRELPPRAERIDNAFQQRDRDSLLELTHQLKGTAGLYGFDKISATARAVCDRLRADDELEGLQAAIQELVDLCRQPASEPPEAPRTNGSLHRA